MSWLSSLILVGAVVSTGTNIPNSNYQNAVSIDSNSSKTIVIGDDETETFEKTYPFNPNGKIEVSNVNGSIYIEAWDRPEIYLSAKKVADSKERLNDVEINIDPSQSNFKASTDYKRNNKYKNGKRYNHGKLYVTFRLKVPRTAFLDDIETVNGGVTVSNMTNYTDISAVNGGVKASNLSGTAKLNTVNGSVYADFDNLNGSSSISLGTVNGSVKLNIPSNANATIKADTVNGRISNEFGLPVRKGKYVGRDLYGRIGSGDVKIKLTSVNGGLSINNKDGGNTNPAVNLLPQKTSDDFDESFDSRMRINTDKMNVAIDKSVSEAKKIAEVAIRENSKRQREVRNKQRDKEREMRDRQREKEREVRKQRREKEREIREENRTVNKEKFEEIESETERFEEDMLRASEAVYLTRRSPFIQEKTGSFNVQGIAKVTVDAEDCDVVVKGWKGNKVKYTISRITRTGNNTKDLKTRISSDLSRVEIEVTNDSPSTYSSREMVNKVRLEVFVPKKSNLKVSSNQEIRLEGVSGELELNGQDESINVRDSSGMLKIDTSDGTVRIIGFNGEVKSNSKDGNVYLEGNFKKIKSHSKDGDVYLTLPNDVNATLTTNGEVDIRDVKLGKVIKVQDDKIKTLNIGKGGHNYNFNFKDGSLVIRSRSSLSS